MSEFKIGDFVYLKSHGRSKFEILSIYHVFGQTWVTLLKQGATHITQARLSDTSKNFVNKISKNFFIALDDNNKLVVATNPFNDRPFAETTLVFEKEEK